MRKTVTWLFYQDSGCDASQPGHNLLCFGITKNMTNSRRSNQVVMTELGIDCSSTQLIQQRAHHSRDNSNVPDTAAAAAAAAEVDVR